MIAVVNKYHTSEGQFIGRPSPLGNPYSHLEGTRAQFKVDTREEAVAKYGSWLADQIRNKNWEIINELNRLLELARAGDLKLRCFCAPKACHGDVVKYYLEAQLAKEKMQEPVFVFGSNTQGYHGRGAALEAYNKHGAVRGQGRGHFGNSYALATCGKWDPGTRRFPHLALLVIRENILEFISYAKLSPELTFKVTRVGCGLAKLTNADIAPFFKDAPDNCQFDEAWKPWLPNKKFWGTF